MCSLIGQVQALVLSVVAVACTLELARLLFLKLGQDCRATPVKTLQFAISKHALKTVLFLTGFRPAHVQNHVDKGSRRRLDML